MSHISELIRNSCSGGVPFKTLGEIGVLIRGNGMPKTDFTESGVGAIHYGQIYTYFGTWTTETVSHVAPTTAERLTKVDPGDVIITNTSENLDDVGKAVAWLGKDQIVTGGHATVLKHNEDARYIAYCLQTPGFFAQKRKLASGTKVIDVSAKALAKIKIPIPPIEVQREVVKILDQFWESKAKLEAELNAESETRDRQYAYYRDSILTSPEVGGIKWMALSEFAEFKYGYTTSAKEEGGYRFIRITDINSWGKLSSHNAKFVDADGGAEDYLVSRGDLLMARTGATYGKTMIVDSDEPAVFASFLIRIRLDNSVMLPAFYWHFAQSNLYWAQAKSMVSAGGQPQFNANALRRVEVPTPSIDAQRRAITLLDRFNGLKSGLSSGLHDEISARREQYEHYRNRLLTFGEKSV